MLVRQHIMKRSMQDDGKKAAAQRQGGEGLDEERGGPSDGGKKAAAQRQGGEALARGGLSCCRLFCKSHDSDASSPALQGAACDAAMRDSSSSSDSSSDESDESHTEIQAAINSFLTPGLSPRGRTDLALGKALKLFMSKEMLENEDVKEIMCKHPNLIRLVFNEHQLDEEWLRKVNEEVWHVVSDMTGEEQLKPKISEVWLAEGEAQDTVQGLEKTCLDYREGVAKVLENVVACLSKRQKGSPFLWSRLRKEQPEEYRIPMQEIAR